MAATRKPARCDCGAILRTYVTASGLTLTEYAAVCLKCKRVYKRPVCFDRVTMETQTDSKIVTTVLKKINVTVTPIKETVEIIEK